MLLLIQRPGVDTSIVAELDLLGAELLDDLSVSLAHGLDLEEAVHRLEGQTLGLGNQEVDESGRHDHEGGEEEVDAVGHGEEHLRGEARDDEVPEPVVGGGRGLADGARVLVEHFRVEDPGHRVLLKEEEKMLVI